MSKEESEARDFAAKLYHDKYNDEVAAVRFADQLLQVWPQVAYIYRERNQLAHAAMAMLKVHPKAIISAKNLRIAGGKPPRFSNRLRATQ